MNLYSSPNFDELFEVATDTNGKLKVKIKFIK